MDPMASPHDQDQEIIKLLEGMGASGVEYPPELLAARRADFIASIQQPSREEVKETLPAGRQFTNRLRELHSIQSEYPSELLTARRAAFVAQLEHYHPAEVKEELFDRDWQLIRLLKRIKSLEPGYPPRLLAARRSALMRQAVHGGQINLLDVWRFAFQRLFSAKLRLPSLPIQNAMRTSLVMVMLMLAAYAGSLLGTGGSVMQAFRGQVEVRQQVPGLATNTGETTEVICKPGYLPPLCLAKEFEPEHDLTYQGNGSARPAVAKDTMPGYGGVHQPAYVNDGLYGPGASWISNSAYSWIKLDLGKVTTINTVTFGRDRLGNFNDRDPGQFVIAVALNDNVYADGDSSKDYIEYTQVYHSQEAGFSGIISGSQTVRAAFQPVTARYVKIIFANAGTAVDEVEIFMVQPPGVADRSTRKPRDEQPAVPATAVPSNTPFPTDTAIPAPTDTPVPQPTDTPTDIPPTSTPRPTLTPTPEPTDTPPPTRTPTPEPTNTPVPTDTPAPAPTYTLEPIVGFTETPMVISTP
jgi:hypothetical protein